jgi:hypothetical protein
MRQAMTISDMFAGIPATAQAPYLVTEAKVREFERSIGARTPPLPAAGARPAPPTFAALIVQPAEAKAVAQLLDPGTRPRLVQLDQLLEFTRPIRVGDRLVTTTTVVTDKHLGRRRIVAVATDIHTVDGERVGRSRATVLMRGGA